MTGERVEVRVRSLPNAEGEMFCAVAGCESVGTPPDGYHIFICGGGCLVEFQRLLRKQARHARAAKRRSA